MVYSVRIGNTHAHGRWESYRNNIQLFRIRCNDLWFFGATHLQVKSQTNAQYDAAHERNTRATN